MPSRSHHVTLALLMIAGISFALMQTLVVPALPFFEREFDTTPAGTTWLVTSFLLSSSVLTSILGKLGDAHGKKRLLVISLAIFAMASLGASLAPNIGWLVGLRARQARRSSRSASGSSATSSRRTRSGSRSAR